MSAARPHAATAIGLVLAACALAACLSTQLVSNAMMLMMDRSNFIPEPSSIFFFEPYVISDGSSNAWLYGKDQTYYYHFTYRADAPYVYIAQKNTCRGFDRTDVRTWCSVRTRAPRAAAGKKI
ncbi:hypothetical protein [Stenotrophomonas sp.]|uniref:hypothetical protein n=1 Tax=Stenotrophomonas sp. TaxID=69392 RepID=UPI0028AF1C1A|nr:hypothetical protein [Stenotrophomonas sp.]